MTAVDFFDLTQPVFNGMPVPPGDPPVSVSRARTHSLDGYEVSEISLGSHTGTHLDAPRHFFADGACLDAYPVERLIGPGVLVDCHTEVDSEAIDAPQLAERLGTVGLPAGTMVLLRTGGRRLTRAAAQLLVDAGAGLVGVDLPSPDDEPYDVHRVLLGAGVLLLENVQGLERLEPGPLMCACLPLAVAGTDGAPARVVVWR